MSVRWTSLFLLVAVAGCQDKKSDPGGGTGRTSDPPGATSPAAGPLTGAVGGKPFTPDQVVLEGKALSFRQGKDSPPDLEIKLDLPEGSGSKLEGREWKFDANKIGDPLLWVRRKEDKEGPPADYTMTLKVTKQTAKAIEGVIDLKVTRPADTHLAGTFTAAVKKTLDDPLDAEDAPFVRGRIVIVGPWTEERLTVGFHGRGEDGKDYANLAGSTVAPGKGGGAMSVSFQPQLTALTNPAKDGPGYWHTRLPPGEYVVYVRRNEVLAAWQKVTVKAGDQKSVDLTVDAAKTGEVAVTIPDEEASDAGDWHLSLVPSELDRPGASYHYAFNAAQVKKGQKSVTVKGVPAGKYRAVRGQSEAVVEVVAKKSTPVTLVRLEEKKK